MSDPWARSGAMWLTGLPDGPPLTISAPVAATVEAAGARFEGLAAGLGCAVAIDWAGLLGERAAIAGLTRGGQVSAGGACRLLPATDGWVAVNLARPDDIDLIPAWLGVDAGRDEPWDAVACGVATAHSAHLVDQAALLGIPVAAVPEPQAAAARARVPAVYRRPIAPVAVAQTSNTPTR